MNGIISRKALRFTAVTSACLFSGFVAGTIYEVGNHLFQSKQIDYSKISWISQEFEQKPVQFAQIDYPRSKLESIELKISEVKIPEDIQYPEPFVQKPSEKNLQKLALILELSDKLSQNAFADYRNAYAQMHNHFQYVMNVPNVNPVIPSQIASVPHVRAKMAAAPMKKEPPSVSNLKVIPEIQKLTSKVEFVMSSAKPAPVKIVRKQKPHRKKLNTQQMNIQTLAIAKNVFSQISQIHQSETVATPEIDPEFIQKQIIQPDEVVMEYSSAKAEKVEVNAAKTKETENLSKNIEDQLLNLHVVQQNELKVQAAPIAQVAQNTSIKTQPHQKPSAQNINQKIDLDKIEAEDDAAEVEGESEVALTGLEHKPGTCATLPRLKLVLAYDGGSSTQICAEQAEWLSKNWKYKNLEAGWVKAVIPNFTSILSFYNSEIDSSALLLEQNSLAMLSLRTGTKIHSGMGMIFGTVPEGYEVEFKGRAEEAQYFEVNQVKYFAILNAEPGAGITEMVSKKDQSKNATVFTPVLGDTITYLTLKAPLQLNIPVKVLKKDQTEVGGLTVGLSTQTQVRAITGVDGNAVLRNVNIIPGYPVFVDVSSKVKTNNPNPSKQWIPGYQYRYELKRETRDGKFLLRQLSEKQIYHWMKQVETGLSDQSAMIYAQIRRQKLDGFKYNYFMKTEPKTERFGLAPLNYSVLWNEKLSNNDPLEGDVPRFISVQVPEGLSQVKVVDENGQMIQSNLIPVSPRVIHMISE